jgi:hypothetical protein
VSGIDISPGSSEAGGWVCSGGVGTGGCISDPVVCAIRAAGRTSAPATASILIFKVIWSSNIACGDQRGAHPEGVRTRRRIVRSERRPA